MDGLMFFVVLGFSALMICCVVVAMVAAHIHSKPKANAVRDEYWDKFI